MSSFVDVPYRHKHDWATVRDLLLHTQLAARTDRWPTIVELRIVCHPARTDWIKHVWLDRAHDATGAATVSAYATSGAEVIDAVDRLMHERRHGLPRSTSVDTTVSMVQPC